jgi:prephenate dehydrogenase
VKLMWINFPHMPTGRVSSRDTLARLVTLARRNRFLLVSDNPYAMMQSEGPLSLLSIDGARDVALELGSLSKSHNMAGWRVGWVAGRREHIDVVLRVRSNMDSGMFLPIQLAAATALETSGDWFSLLNSTYAARRLTAEAILRTLGCTFAAGQAGLFVWAKAPDSVPDVEEWLDGILHETKVFITPGFIFGEAGRRHVRVSLCNPVEVLDEARKRLEGFVAALSPQPATGCDSDSSRSETTNTASGSRLGSHLLPLHDPTLHSGIRTSYSALTIIGLGLIGGSIAIDLRRSGFASHVVGIDANPENAETALGRGLVDEIGSLDDSLPDSDVVVLAIPVDDIERLSPGILDRIGERSVVIDTGSTKRSICEAITSHPRRGSFVASHPIAGTENSGPEAALSGLFRGKVNIICERERSSGRALDTAAELFARLGMRTVFMGPREHDLHLAYVSHLSHVTSFVLGQTVLDIENDEKSIFLLAGSGFASTVRLAKSSPAMWAPIFDRNSSFLTKALDEYIAHMQRFRQALMDRDLERLRTIMNEANEIRRVLANMEEPPDGQSDAVVELAAGVALSDQNQGGVCAPHATGETS